MDFLQMTDLGRIHELGIPQKSNLTIGLKLGNL